MGKAQREKGKRGEREVAAILKEHGYEDARRTSQYCGQTGDASDVIGLEGFHLEVKRCNTTKIHEWMEQATRDAKELETPVVIHRRDRDDWLITMKFEDFLEEIKK